MVDRNKPTLFGVDRARVLTPADLPRLRDVVGPLDWVTVYIGGPRSGGVGWTREAVQALANAQPGLGFLPIYVGRNLPWDATYSAWEGSDDADRAEALENSFGLSAQGGPLCLDVEYQTWDGNYPGFRDYVLAWCDRVEELGLVPVVYGPTGMCAWVQEVRPNVKTWAAYWPSTGDTWVRLQGAARPMLNLTVGGLHRTPDAWQFVGSAPVIGGIDASVSRGDFPLAELQPTGTTGETDVTSWNAPQTVEEAKARDLTAEVDSLSGSAGELYARVGELERALGELLARTGAPVVLTPYVAPDEKAAPELVDYNSTHPQPVDYYPPTLPATPTLPTAPATIG